VEKQRETIKSCGIISKYQPEDSETEIACQPETLRRFGKKSDGIMPQGVQATENDLIVGDKAVIECGQVSK
jgi:hypothetical protein